jgi:hypothetical protein
MILSEEQDRQMLGSVPKEKLFDLFFLHIRNLWRIDGLYFLGIEEKFGTNATTEIDANCWKLMGKIEARELKEVLGIKENDLYSLLKILRNTSWALYQTKKEIDITKTSIVFRVTNCRIQETRVRKGLDIFPCKPVRFGYLKRFAEELNPKIEVTCKVCPPDKKTEGFWCEWEFKLLS